MNTAQIVHSQVDKRTVSLGEAEAAAPLTVQQVLGQVALIQQIMKAAMKEGEHFGRIPGCGNKPSLLKPGAEKLCLTFRLAPSYDVEERQLERGHREYRITATLTSILSGTLVGQGVGSCSTLENKYRYRAGAAEVTERPVPRAYWDIRQDDPAKAQELIGGAGFTVKKVDGQGWMVAKGGEKVETDNPADTYNTVLKMGKKRALVDAVLTATAASDIFTQDLEDISANLATMTTAPVSAAPAVSTLATAEAEPTPPAQTHPAPVEPAPTVQPTAAAAEAVDFRLTEIHFGKNRGLTLAELTPQQLHWYEAEWMPKKETQGARNEGDRALISGLKAYREWREARKRRFRHRVPRVNARPPKHGLCNTAKNDCPGSNGTAAGPAQRQADTSKYRRSDGPARVCIARENAFRCARQHALGSNPGMFDLHLGMTLSEYQIRWLDIVDAATEVTATAKEECVRLHKLAKVKGPHWRHWRAEAEKVEGFIAGAFSVAEEWYIKATEPLLTAYEARFPDDEWFRLVLADYRACEAYGSLTLRQIIDLEGDLLSGVSASDG